MCANQRFSFYINKNYMMPFKLDKAKLTIGMTWCLFETKTELCFDVFQSTDKRCNDAKARAIGKAVSLFLLNLLKFFPAYSWVVQHDSKDYQVKVFGLSRNGTNQVDTNLSVQVVYNMEFVLISLRLCKL